MSRLAIHSQDPDGGFKKISVTKTHEDYRAKFVLFDLLEHGGNHFFYFHSWYQRYKNALIVTYVAKNVSEMCPVINTLSYNYSLKKSEQILYTAEDISEVMQSPDYVVQLKEALVGSNCMIIYRKLNKADSPILAIKLETYATVGSVVRVKPGIYIPKNLQPRHLISTTTPKKSIHDLLKRKKVEDIDPDLGSSCENF